LRQEDFGIRRTATFFGGLKVKSEVVVRLSVPAAPTPRAERRLRALHAPDVALEVLAIDERADLEPVAVDRR
jgi:hypothetical protein